LPTAPLHAQAECLQSWADLRRELQRQAPNEQLGSQQQEQQVQQAAAEAYRASLQAYQQVPAAAGSAALRSDAAVNAANVLCSLAELSTGAEAGQLLQQAVGLYQAALQQEREDADVSAAAPGRAVRCCVWHSLTHVPPPALRTTATTDTEQPGRCTGGAG
jgi:hypothetical protein